MATVDEQLADLKAAVAEMANVVSVMAKAQGFRPDIRADLETTTDRVRPGGRT